MPHYEFFSDSPRVENDPLILEGVWLHDPDRPQSTVKQYRFGRDVRSSSRDIGGTSLVFAGRRFPVVEYGEHQDDIISIRVDVAHGETYQAELESLQEFAELKKTLVFRDNRSRVMFGTMSGFADNDQATGSEVNFDMNRVSREVVTL